eukprot:3350698-Prymnesium_polylepis.2
MAIRRLTSISGTMKRKPVYMIMKQTPRLVDRFAYLCVRASEGERSRCESGAVGFIYGGVECREGRA